MKTVKYVIAILCLLSLIGLAAVQGTSAYFADVEQSSGNVIQAGVDGWWLGDWAKRVKLTIDHTDINNTLSDFPVLVYLSTSSGRTPTNVSCVFDELTSDDNREKIAVTKSNGTTQCYVEIEKWDDANEQAWLWVKVPDIASDADTDLYLYYDKNHADNTDYVGDPNSSPAENVWDDNFKMVQHLHEGSGSTAGDSTANDNDGIIYGAMGKAESGTINALTDSDKSWTSDEWAGETIEITRGTGSGQTRTVASNTDTVITVSSDWVTNPDATSEYRVTSGHEWITSGKLDDAIDFDEVDDLIRVPDNASLDGTNDAGTFELWIWWDDAADGDWQIVMSSSNRFTPGFQDGYEWASQGDGNHYFYPWGDENNDNYNITSSSPYTNQTWHHAAITLKNTTEKDVDLYVDGSLVAWDTENVPTYWTTLASPDDWLWGGNPDRSLWSDITGDRYFDGMMDEVRVSDIARTAAWIKASYESESDDLIHFGSEETE